MESVELYTTHCPKCHVLETKLKNKNIVFNTCEGPDAIKIMKENKFFSAPVLKVNDKFMDFSEAIAWVNTKE